jgi:predicted transcriptional regulator YdeE
MGIADRVGPNEHTKVAEVWAKYFAEQVAQKIVDKKPDANLLAVYTEYGEDGSYTLFLGEEVMSIDRPGNLQTLIIPAQDYAQIIAGPGMCPDHLANGWQSVWNRDPKDFGGKRNMIADFEYMVTKPEDREKCPSVAVIYVGVDLSAA